MNKYIIEKANLINNINLIKGMTNSEIIAMIKCNGYGIGLIPYAEILKENGINIFAVSEYVDALSLKERFPENDILLLTSYCDESVIEEIVTKGIIGTVASPDSAEIFDKVGKKLNCKPNVHLEINTGMGRGGFNYKNIHEILKLQDMNFRISGTFTHFSFSFSKNKNDVLVPLKHFKDTVKSLNDKGFDTGALHVSNSSAFLKFKETHLDMVRIGSAFLGRIIEPNTYGFKKVGYLESKIIDTNFLEKGSNVGYGNTYKTKKATKTAIVPVGYFHGFMTEKSMDTFRLRDKLRNILKVVKANQKYVTVNGNKVPVIGRVGMFNIILDITDTDIKANDKVKIDVSPIIISSETEKKYI